MRMKLAFAAVVALFQLVALHLGGAALSPALAGAVTALTLSCLGIGDALLRLAGHPLHAALPAAFVAGFGVVSVTLFALAQTAGLSPLTGVEVFAAAGLIVLLLPDGERPGGRADLGWTLIMALVVLAVALSAIRAPVVMQTDGVLPIWYDFLLHGISINAFAGLQGLPTDPEMAGATLIPYHYAPFVPPAALIEAAGMTGLTAAAAHLLPLGLLIGAMGLYALVTQLAGRGAAVIALALLVLVPDPADYMLRSGWFDMAWIVFGSPGSGYGMGLCFVAAASLTASLRQHGTWDRALLLGVGLALLSILERVQMFMLMAPPLLALWLWAIAPRLRRPAVIGLAVLAVAIALTFALLPGVRAEWLARAKIIEYFEIAVNWTEGYGTWIAPWIGSGFLARVVQLVLIVTLSLGVFLLTAPLAAALKLRRAGGEVMDLLPLFALGMYVILILFAPPGGNGDFSEYKHRHFVELYWLFAGFTAAWAAQALPGRMVRPLAGATAVAAVLWSGWIAGRPIDAPNVTALPWAKDYFGQPVTKGIPAVAAFILAQARPGDVLAVDAAASQARLGPMNEVMALADVQAYLARGDLKSLRSACHDGVVKERVGLLQRVDAARDADAAMDLLAKAGLRFFVALSGLPRWDPAGARAAFLTDGVAVYILHRVPGEPALQAVCP